MAWLSLPMDHTSRVQLGVDSGNVRDDTSGMLLDSGQSDKELLATWREVAGVIFAVAMPSPLGDPELICHSPSALLALGMSTPPAATELCGNVLPDAAFPAAHCYCGHQFGLFAGQLGDGAAISLGDVLTPSGTLIELGLKGAGPTPFTRADVDTGRKQVSSAVVEMLVAESLAALGVPTSRGLGVVAGKAEDGDGCAVLARSALSFLRFGSFEVTLPRNHDKTGRHAPSAGDSALLRRLADYVIGRHFGHLAGSQYEDEEEDDAELRAAPRYSQLIFEMTSRTARLAAAWQLLGACHGMLNSDNIAVSGETIDHGSFAFMDHASPAFAGRYSLPDSRYRYENQPAEALQACQRLVVTLQPLHCTRAREMQESVAAAFEDAYQRAYNEGMRRKLGLCNANPALADGLVSL